MDTSRASLARARFYGRYVASHEPKARIAVLYENSDFGKDMLNGLRRGLGGKAKIVGTQAYEIADSSVASQMARLKSTGADTLMLFATPQFAIFGYVGAFRLGWHRTSTSRRSSISPDIMKIRAGRIQPQAGRGLDLDRLREGPDLQAVGEGQDRPALPVDPPAFPAQREIGGRVQLLRDGGRLHDVDTLKKAGRNPTRASVLNAATHLDETNPFNAAGSTDQDLAERLLPDRSSQARPHSGITGASSASWSTHEIRVNSCGNRASMEGLSHFEVRKEGYENNPQTGRARSCGHRRAGIRRKRAGYAEAERQADDHVAHDQGVPSAD